MLQPLLAQQHFSLLLNSANQSPFLSFAGDALQFSDHIELAEINSTNSAGTVFYNKEIHLLDPCINPNRLRSFSTSFTFQIAPVDGPPADGMAFIITYGMPYTPMYSTGAGLGMITTRANANSLYQHILAIEFDTYQNIEYNDPARPHVGIDVSSLKSLENVIVPDDVALDRNFTLTAWIDYTAATDQLQIRLSRNTTKPEMVLLNHAIGNLSNVIMDTMYLGFSASTGSTQVASYRVYSWNFSASDSTCLNGSKLVLPLVSALLSLSIAIYLLTGSWLWWKLKRQKCMSTYTYEQLKTATRNFSQDNLLGDGKYGEVYRGILENGHDVAIKVLKDVVCEDQMQNIAQLAEISILRHKNLVTLMGWCIKKGKLMLVYDYMPNGSLDKYLFDPTYSFSWQQRYNIILGVAEGLAFLHHGWEQKIIHRNVKASNILLDRYFNAHLGDFGIAELLVSDASVDSILAKDVTEKYDVYSFGSLALEIATGKSVSERNLVEEVKSMKLRGNILDAADPQLNAMGFDSMQMEKVLTLGLLCCEHDPDHRPKMRKCCHVLWKGPFTPLC